MKRFITFGMITFAILAGVLCVDSAFAFTRLKVVGSTTLAGSGQDFTLDVVAEGIPVEGLGGVQFRLNIQADSGTVVGVDNLSLAAENVISLASPLLNAPPSTTASGIGDFFWNARGSNGVLFTENQALTNGSALYTFAHTFGSVHPSGSGSVARFLVHIGTGVKPGLLTVSLTDVVLLDGGSAYPLDFISGTMVQIPCTATVPQLIGLTRTQAESALAAANLTPGTINEIHTSFADGKFGIIRAQSAVTGTTLNCNSVTSPSYVYLTINTALADVTGLSASDKIGDDTGRLLLSWTASPSTGVTGYRIYRAGIKIADVVDSSATGIELSGLSNGVSQELRVVTVDASGNESPGAVVTGTALDDVYPVVDVTGIIDGTFYKDTLLTVRGTARDTNGVSVIINGIPATNISLNDGSFSLDVPLVAGANILAVTATDPSGNQTFVTRSVNLDTTPPTLTISSLADGAYTNNATLNISGIVTDNSGVASLTVNNNSVSFDAAGSYSTAISLQPGTNNISVIAVDTAGNQTSDSRNVTLDQSAPTLSVSTPADNSKTAQSLATVSGTINETSTVTVIVNSGVPQNAAITGSSFSTDVNLTAGLNSISITATDLVGNVTSVVRSVTSDTTKPSLAITDPAQDVTVNLNSITISGTVSDTITSPVVTVQFNNQTFTPAISNGAFTQQLTIPAGGTHLITATATDEVGNTATASRNVIYVIPGNGACGSSNGSAFQITPTTNLCSAGTASSVTGSGPWNWTCSVSNSGTTASCTASQDISGPTLVITAPADSAITNNATLTVTGSVSDSNGIVTLKINNTLVSVTNGTFSHTVTLQAGANTITIVAVDTAGNSTTDTRSITLDQTAPTLTVTTPLHNSKTAQASVTVSGSINETSTVTITVNSGTPQNAVITGKSFTATVTLSSGLNSITATATDLAGNSTTVVRSVTSDTTKPLLVVTTPHQDLTTSQSSLTLNGTVSDAITTATLIISFNGQTLTPAVTNGAFSQAVTFSTEQTYAIIVTATDEVGNTSSVTRAVTYAKPRDVSQAGAVDKPGDESGAVLLSWTPPVPNTLSGYRIYRGTTLVKEITDPTATGTEIGGLTNTTPTQLRIAGYDSLNSESNGVLVSAVARDDVAPSVIITAKPADPGNQASGSISFSSTDSTANFACKLDSGAFAVCTSPSAFSNLTAGAHTFSVHGTDFAGNISADVSATFTIDLSGPSLTVSTLADAGITNNATLNISGIVTDSSGVASLTVNSSSVTFDASGTYSTAITLQPGANSIRVIAIDTTGNQTSDNRSVTLDQSAPTLIVSTPADNSKTAQSLATVSGTINETSTVTVIVNSGTPQNVAITGSSFTTDVNLPAGLNSISITATDLVGNSASVVRSVTSDTTKPSLAITDPAQDVTVNLNSITISGTVSDTITSPVVTVQFNNQTFTPAISNGAFTQQLTIPAGGTHLITATATDEVGNTTVVNRNIIYVAPPRDGIINSENGKNSPDIGDALAVFLHVVGKSKLNGVQLGHVDVAPPGENGRPKGNGKVDIADVIMLLRRVVDIDNW